MTDNTNEYLDNLITRDGEFSSGAKRRKKLGKPDPELIKWSNRRKAERRWREKNKDEINKKRRFYNKTPRGAYKKMKAKAQERDVEFELTFEGFVSAWENCPAVFDHESRTWRSAWSMRGSNIQKHTQLCRIDTEKPWADDNVEVRYKNQPVPEDGKVGEWCFEKVEADLPIV